MTKVLITGSGSFVGNNFRKYSIFRDIEEISLIDNKPEEINYSGFDVVLHLAAIVHQSVKIPESEYFLVNRDLCLRVAEASKSAGVKQFIFLSTLKVYGEQVSAQEPRNENSECLPDDPYGKSKFAAESGLKRLESEHFTVTIVRTALVYGEGVKANMINLVKLVDTFRVLPLGHIQNRRSFTFAENLVKLLDKIILSRASGIFIALDDKSISTTELVKYISKSLGKKTRLFRMPGLCLKLCRIFSPGTIDRLYGSLEFENKKTRQMLDYNPPVSTEEGINRMVSFYLQHKKSPI